MSADSKTTLEELKQTVRRFCEERDWDQFHNAKDLVIGIVTEGSELLEQFRFKSENEITLMFKSRRERQRITEEIADTLYFVLRLAQRYQVDLSTGLQKKIRQNEKRYPVARAKGSNKKYADFSA